MACRSNVFLGLQAEAIKQKLHGDSAPVTDGDQPARLLITSDQVGGRFSSLEWIWFCTPVEFDTVCDHFQLILSVCKGYGEQRGDTGEATECRRSQGVHQG